MLAKPNNSFQADNKGLNAQSISSDFGSLSSPPKVAVARKYQKDRRQLRQTVLCDFLPKADIMWILRQETMTISEFSAFLGHYCHNAEADYI